MSDTTADHPDQNPTPLPAHATTDPYAWLRDRDTSRTREHLAAERHRAEAALAPLAALRDALVEEMLARVPEVEESAPARWGEWWYRTRQHRDADYPVYLRRRHGSDEDQVVLDLVELAAGSQHLELGAFRPSPDHRLLAYSLDTRGDELFTLRVRDLGTGEDLPDEVPGTFGSVAWSADGQGLLYTTLDPAQRPHRLWYHRLGAEGEDRLLYEEEDERFWLELQPSREGRFAILHAQSMITSEARAVDLAEPEEEPRVVLPRRHDVLYDVTPHEDRFYVLVADTEPDRRLAATPVEEPGWESLEEIVPGSPGTAMVRLDAFEDHLVLTERDQGVPRLRLLDPLEGPPRLVIFPDEVCEVTPAANHEFCSPVFRYVYATPVQPDRVEELDLESMRCEVIWSREVGGGFDPSRYETRRIRATAADGTEIPVTLTYRPDLLDGRGGGNPTVIEAYGSYGIEESLGFSRKLPSMLDRGVVHATAHVRGGGFLGKRWHRAGRVLSKATTFSDIVAVAEHLLAEKVARPDALGLRGGSAGGLMVAAVLNLRPELFTAALAEVPFVDCWNTLRDPELPLTVIEWEEWGNPAVPEEAAGIRTWSPYENLREEAYPAVLATTGMHDPRVGFWEAAKWVARLRDTRCDDGPTLLHVIEGGHQGATGLKERLAEVALGYAFLLDRLGATTERSD